MSEILSPVYVFDLDGVITNPVDSSVNYELIKHIGNIVAGHGYVAVNTGRSYEWVSRNFVSLLRREVSLDSHAHLFIACEKGGESLVWKGGGLKAQPSRFVLDRTAYDAARRIFLSYQAELTTMFWDNTKRTMATVEKEPSADLDEFHRQQARLVTLLNQSSRFRDARVDPSTIATDVESLAAGKRAGAELIYEWAVKADAHGAFVCFGDSPGDYEMARYFAQRGAGTCFVFVGKDTDYFSEDERVQTVRTAQHYDQGALEYLGSHSHREMLPTDLAPDCQAGRPTSGVLEKRTGHPARTGRAGS